MSQPKPSEPVSSGERDVPAPSPRVEGMGEVSPSPEVADIGFAPTLRGPVTGNAAVPAAGTLPEVEPSRYAIVSELARGGIGRILRARDVRLGRPVAIKEMLAPARDAEARFVAEALVTARLQHPSIVPVYEAGRWPSGEPFYAMKLVSGRSLAAVIAERPTLEERLALLPHVLAVAEAMSYAHSERIIHRDLKPANVLVGAFGETVVIDWGLAKDLSREEPVGAPLEAGPGNPSGDGALTRVGSVMGTPAYMPPEQAAGQPVDERADVYALGAILYHLLAGVQPYDGGSSEQVLQKVVRGPPPELARRQAFIPPELHAIVSKAMAREPSARYATARELAEDLRRFQTGQIVGAHRYSRVELARRLVRRYRAPLAVAAVALVLLAGLGVASVRRVLTERDKAQEAHSAAEHAREEAQARTDALLLLQARHAVATDPNAAIRWLRDLSEGFTGWSAARTIAADAKAHGFADVLRGHTQAINDFRFTRDGRALVSTSDDYTVRVWDLARDGVRVLSGHTDEAWVVRILPDDRRFISGGKDGTLRLWSLDTGEGRLFAALPGPVSAVSLREDGGRLLAMSRADEVLHLWDVGSGESRAFATGLKGATGLAWAPDGRHVFLHKEQSAEAALGDLERGTFQRLPPEAGVVWSYTFTPEGELLTGSSAGHLDAWEPATGRRRVVGEGLGVITALAVVPGAGQVAVGNLNGEVWLWDVGARRGRLLGSHEAKVLSMDVTRDGRYLASGSTDRTARLWELSTGEVRTLRGAREQIQRLGFSPDGRRLAVASADGQVRLFPVETDTHHVLAHLSGTVLALVRSPEGQRLAALMASGTLRLLDGATGALVREAPGFAGKDAVGFSPDGRWLAAAGARGGLVLWAADTGHEARVLVGSSSPLHAMAFSRDGRWVAAADGAGEVRLWDVASGTGRVLGPHGRRVFQLAFSPDGRTLASASSDGTARLWDVETGTHRVLEGHEDEVRTLAFSPDGRRLVTGSRDHTLRFWDLESGESLRRDASGAGVQEVLFSPDGALLASRNFKDGCITLWDGHTGEVRRPLTGHYGDVLDLAFSPDGTRLASVGLDKTVRLWDLASGESRVLRGHAGHVGSVLFLPDGRSLLSTGEDGIVRQWPDDLPLAPGALREWMGTVQDSEPVSNLHAR